MARRWTPQEEELYREELLELYVRRNLTIEQVGSHIGIAASSVFQRLQRLGIPSNPASKGGYIIKRTAIRIPESRSEKLAEFMGVMLGDGHISRYQTVVTLGTKEETYAIHTSSLMEELFGVAGTIGVRGDGYRDVYIGSIELVAWLCKEGLVPNKVACQVDVPQWMFAKEMYMQSFLRGFFDTDGSIYRLRHGRQISLTNRSLPLLHSLQMMLVRLRYKPSAVSSYRVYITQKAAVDRFFQEVRPANQKHWERYRHITGI